MRGIVWGLTLQDAQKQLERIERDYEILQVANLVSKLIYKHEIRLEYDNGDCWRAVRASGNHCGLRCSISYIDARIDEDIVTYIIKPSTIYGPYHAINYFYPDVTEEGVE